MNKPYTEEYAFYSNKLSQLGGMFLGGIIGAFSFPIIIAGQQFKKAHQHFSEGVTHSYKSAGILEALKGAGLIIFFPIPMGYGCFQGAKEAKDKGPFSYPSTLMDEKKTRRGSVEIKSSFSFDEQIAIPKTTFFDLAKIFKGSNPKQVSVISINDSDLTVQQNQLFLSAAIKNMLTRFTKPIQSGFNDLLNKAWCADEQQKGISIKQLFKMR